MMLMGVFWIAIVVGGVLVVAWLVTQGRSSRPASPEESALDILKKRYARGEIDKEEFEEKLKGLM